MIGLVELHQEKATMANPNELAQDATAQAQTDSSRPTISDCLDYRKFLRDYFEFKRNENRTALRPYTYSVFSASADIKSPNYLKLIIEGKRNLSQDMIVKFAKAMHLNKQEAEEFAALVKYNQATDPGDRNQFLRDLASLRVRNKIENGEIDENTWRKVPSWVAWVLYAMADQNGVKYTPEDLAKLLRNRITPEEAADTLYNMLSAGQLVRDENTGNILKSRGIVDNLQEIPVALVRKLQTELMYLGLESLFNDNPLEREFGTATLCLTQSEFEELKFQLRKLRKSFQKDIASRRLTTKGDKVYQLNIQLFPLSDAAQPTQQQSLF